MYEYIVARLYNLNKKACEEILRNVTSLLSALEQGYFKLVICGHGVGGCFATLMGLELLAHQLNYPFEIYTFGSPFVLESGVGNTTEIGKALTKRVKNFIYQFDIVPRLQKSWTKNVNLIWICERLKWNISKIEELCSHSFGPIGEYYLLLDQFAPPTVLKKQKIYTRCLEGRCIQLPNPDQLFELVPYHRGTNVKEILQDHAMHRYLSKLLFIDSMQQSISQEGIKKRKRRRKRNFCS